jgi:hypothetical protein
MGLHVFARYLKVAFFDGAGSELQRPVATKQARVRYLHIPEGEAFDEAQRADWIRQRATCPVSRCDGGFRRDRRPHRRTEGRTGKPLNQPDL